MYEIPKISVPVELCLVNQESIKGKLFLTEDMISESGNPKVDEFLNKETDEFFPFESDAGAYRLISKRHVTFLRTFQDDREIRSHTPIPPKSLVVYFTNGQTLYGMVYGTMVEESRVSDIINDTVQFISLYQNGQRLVLNREQIMYVNAK